MENRRAILYGVCVGFAPFFWFWRESAMPEADHAAKEKEFFLDIPVATPGFFLKGAGSYRLGDEEPARAHLPAEQRADGDAGD